jgi:cytidine deaminase
METNSSEFPYSKYASADDLDQADKKLYDAACEASLLSYAPYSKLNVGAALLIDSGEIVTGSNQENASYPSGACAERIALYTAVNKPGFKDSKILAVAIAARRNGDDDIIEISPCGECRQVLSEFSQGTGTKMKIIMPGPNESVVLIYDVTCLLPFVFSNPRPKAL